MLGAAIVTAQFVAGKATRDALFLTALGANALPAMLIGGAACSIVLVFANSRAARHVAPRTLVPALFALSAVLFAAEWFARANAPSAVAVLIYLHISSLGPLLGSGFWLIASERFDPRSAKRRFGQIAAAGTVGGLFGAMVAERMGAWFGTPEMLLFLSAAQIACAVVVRRLSGPLAAEPIPAPAAKRSSALRVVAESPYLRHLAVLVLLGSTSAALVDYLFKVEAVDTFGRGDTLLRFFALYYAGTSFLTLLLQMSSSRLSLERFGLAMTASTPAATLFIGSLASLVAPGFGAILATRGGESVFRSSLFRAGYEVFYTPMPAAQKRAAKSLIDVGFERLGDALGGGGVRLLTALMPWSAATGILALAAGCALGALWAASRLTRGYVGSLEKSLLQRGGVMDSSPDTHQTTRNIMRSLLRMASVDRPPTKRLTAAFGPEVMSNTGLVDPDMRRIADLRSRDRERVVSVLLAEDGIAGPLVAHVIPLLAWDAVANHAIYALRKVAEERVGQLLDALLDPNQDFAIRRRLARVFSVCVSERAAHGLVNALDDVRFDVRYQTARSLAAILDKNPRITLDRERIFEVVLREVAVGRPVWESRRLLDGVSHESPLDSFVRDRAGESLAHVFTLLSLVLPREPLQIAYRSLQTDDQYLRGTALEYLESVLPGAIRERLWPFIEKRPAARSSRPHQEVIADLLRSHESIVMNLEELRRAARTAGKQAV
jgi:hypothetical protein